MKKEIIISGFGGQGALSIGKNLAEAALLVDYNTTWAPSYGPEMRGGTANCSVVISDGLIGSPLFETPTEVIAMNGPSVDKFAPKIMDGGLLFINSSVYKEKYERKGITTYYVPCDDIATKLGNLKVANMVMLGAYVGATGLFDVKTIERLIAEMFTGKKAKLVPLNIEALHAGIKLIEDAKSGYSGLLAA